MSDTQPSKKKNNFGFLSLFCKDKEKILRKEITVAESLLQTGYPRLSLLINIYL